MVGISVTILDHMVPKSEIKDQRFSSHVCSGPHLNTFYEANQGLTVPVREFKRAPVFK